jgi:hypothetical protein
VELSLRCEEWNFPLSWQRNITGARGEFRAQLRQVAVRAVHKLA